MKIRRLLFLLTIALIGIPIQCHAQVTFNADNTGVIEAHPAAALEIQSSDRGVLPPRITSAVRKDMDIDSTMDGLLYFQTDGNIGFYLIQGGKWVFLNPILIPDDGTDNGPGAEGETYSFARVAYTGDYNDLINKPNLSFGGTDENGDTITLSKVALTGDYRDLVDAPVIPSSMSDIATVAKTGRWSDLKNIPVIPTQLRDLEQDTLHMTLTGEERERWNAMASRKVPTLLSDLEQDNYHTLATFDEKQSWTASSLRPVPTKLSELSQDEWYQTVTDAEIARWDASASWVIPTSLRDMEQDTAHRLITRGKKEEWNSYASTKIPSALSDMSSDEYNVTVSYAEKQTWDASAARTVPTKLSELTQDEWYQTVTDAEIARWDASASWVIPTSLRDLEQDTAHRLITRGKKEEWNSYASMRIPKAVSEYATDDYYQYVTLAQKTAWNDKANQPIPTKLSELEYDEFAQLVTDADIARWKAAANRPIPTSLRELQQDEDHRLVNSTQQTRWQNHAEGMAFSGNYADLTDLPEIPQHLSQFETSPWCQTISRKEREKWNNAAARVVPDSLCQLLQDDEEYLLVTDEEIARWNHMYERSLTEIKEYQQGTMPDGKYYFITKGDPTGLQHYRSLSAAGMSGDYNDLINRPIISSGAPTTGSYNDLSEQGRLVLSPGVLKILNQYSYNGLDNIPSLNTEFLNKGAINPLKGYEEMGLGTISGYPYYLSSFQEDAQGESVKVPEKSIIDYKSAYIGLFNPDFYLTDAKNPTGLYGGYTGLKFGSKLTLHGTNVVRDGGDKNCNDCVATVGVAKTLDQERVASINAQQPRIPNGTIIMWPNEELPNGGAKDANNGCWKHFSQLNGKFPVGASSGDYALTKTGGNKEITLNDTHIPIHNHAITVRHVALGGNLAGLAEQKFLGKYETFSESDYESRYTTIGSSAVKEDYSVDQEAPNYKDWYEGTSSHTVRPHENRPAFYAIYFIQYHSTCP